MIENHPVTPISGGLMLGIALLLYVIPVPIFEQIRIDYVALLMLYLSIYRDIPFPLVTAFAVGILQDLVSLAPLGQHALGLLLVVWILQFFRDRMKVGSLPGQIPMVLMLILLLKFQYSWIAALNLGILPSLDALGSSLLTTLVWLPFVFIIRLLEPRQFA
jgi:rod shape-determining protein MreD